MKDSEEADVLEAAAERLAGDGNDSFWDSMKADLIAQHGRLDEYPSGILDGIEHAAGALRTHADSLRTSGRHEQFPTADDIWGSRAKVSHMSWQDAVRAAEALEALRYRKVIDL